MVVLMGTDRRSHAVPEEEHMPMGTVLFGPIFACNEILEFMSGTPKNFEKLLDIRI